MKIKEFFNLGGSDEKNEVKKSVSNSPSISANVEKNLKSPASTGIERKKNENSSTVKSTAEETNTIEKPIFFKPTYDVKLTILLIENSSEMAKQKDKLTQIVKNLVVCDKNSFSTYGFVTIINYGARVRKTELIRRASLNFDELLYYKDLSDNTCFHTAIFDLEDIVCKYNKKLIEEEMKKFFIRNIEVIGIGSCVDNCTKISKDIAISSFNRVARLSNVTTKYFCFTDSTFVEAATIGFHSIGAINRNYK